MTITPMVAMLLCASLVIPRLAATAADPWRIDRAHSRITFAVSKWGFIGVGGQFDDFDGTIVFDRDAPERSSIQWRVKVSSVNTGEPDRDRALQQREYFDAAHHPEISFVSSRVRSLSSERLEVTGTITIRGTSKPLTVQVTYGGGRHGVPDLGPMEIFQTTFRLNRLDFGLAGGRLLGPIISHEATITLVAAARPAE